MKRIEKTMKIDYEGEPFESWDKVTLLELFKRAASTGGFAFEAILANPSHASSILFCSTEPQSMKILDAFIVSK